MRETGNHDYTNSSFPLMTIRRSGSRLKERLSKPDENLTERLDRIYAIALETRADLRDVEDRLDKLEPKSL